MNSIILHLFKFNVQLSTKYRDTVSCKTGFNRQRMDNRQTAHQVHNAFADPC